MKTKFSLVTVYLYYLTLALESQVFIPNNCFMPQNMTRMNGLVGGFRPCLGGPSCLTVLFFCLWGFGFKNLKPLDSEKINLSQFASENLNPIKSTSVAFGESYLSVCQEWAVGFPLCSSWTIGVLLYSMLLNHLFEFPLLFASPQTLYCKTLYTFLYSVCVIQFGGTAFSSTSTPSHLKSYMNHKNSKFSQHDYE